MKNNQMDFCDLLKPCTGCKEMLLKTEFNKDAGKDDGLQTQCRKCKHAAQRRDYRKKKDVYMERQKIRRKAEPEKKQANEAVRRAIRKGVLVRPESCTECGQSHMRIEAHHHKGYAKEDRLNVVFLCTSCHRAAEKS